MFFFIVAHVDGIYSQLLEVGNQILIILKMFFLAIFLCNRLFDLKNLLS